MRLEYTLNPLRIALALAVAALFLAAQSLIMEYLVVNVLDANAHSGLILALDLFSVNLEESIPTWYATLLLFGAALLLAIITAAKVKAKATDTRPWLGLVVIFLYLSIDEGAAVHEVIADILQTQFTPTGYLFFAWQIVAAPLVLLFGVVYWRFLFRLPPRTRNLFTLAGIIYVGGALVVEGISANRWYLDGGETFEYLAIATVEELSEMLGVVLFIYALLAYIARMQYAVALVPSLTVPDTRESTTEQLHAERAQTPGGQSMPRWLQRPVVIIVLLIVVANAALVTWALTQQAGQVAAINQAIIDQLRAFDVQVMPLDGHFGMENLPSRQKAAELLAEHDEVMIVTWASTDASMALAADAMPFDRNQLTQMLQAHGETQFVIFDTLAVRALVGDLHPLPPD
ncbi:MAG: hypothetical protein CL610_21885 [Anaerolineaceae bacterium]|nr:hypothetical protein [Anaerolineaceae bacterium]